MLPRIQKNRASKLFDMLMLSPTIDLDSSFKDTVILDGALAEQWTDRSGGGIDALQATPANKPSYTSTKNGHSILSFSTDNYFSLALSVATGKTLVIVAKFNSTSTQFLCDGAGAFDERLAVFIDTGGTKAIIGSTTSAAYSASTAWHIHRIFKNGGLTKYQRDDETEKSISAGTKTTPSMYIGCNFVIDRFLNGDYAKFSIIPRDLTANEQKIIQSALSAKWAI